MLFTSKMINGKYETVWIDDALCIMQCTHLSDGSCWYRIKVAGQPYGEGWQITREEFERVVSKLDKNKRFFLRRKV